MTRVPPRLIAETSGLVVGEPDAVYGCFREIDLTMILTGLGPLPAVVSVDASSDRWDTPGQERVLRLADGNSLREIMREVDWPSGFSYDIDSITGPLGRLVTGMSGRWSFESVGTHAAVPQTRARWRYEFTLRSRWAWPPSALIVKFLWRPYMGQVLARAAAQASALRAGEGRGAARRVTRAL